MFCIVLCNKLAPHFPAPAVSVTVDAFSYPVHPSLPTVDSNFSVVLLGQKLFSVGGGGVFRTKNLLRTRKRIHTFVVIVLHNAMWHVYSIIIVCLLPFVEVRVCLVCFYIEMFTICVKMNFFDKIY